MRFGANLESSGFNRAPQYTKDTILTATLLFAQFSRASSDLLEYFFQLALLLGRDILKCTFDGGGVLPEDRENPGQVP